MRSQIPWQPLISLCLRVDHRRRTAEMPVQTEHDGATGEGHSLCASARPNALHPACACPQSPITPSRVAVDIARRAATSAKPVPDAPPERRSDAPPTDSTPHPDSDSARGSPRVRRKTALMDFLAGCTKELTAALAEDSEDEPAEGMIPLEVMGLSTGFTPNVAKTSASLVSDDFSSL